MGDCDETRAGDWVTRGRFAVPVERSAVDRSWRQRGYSCGLFVDPPGREWRDFVHGTDELVTVVEGRLRLTVGGAVIVADPGDEIFIPAGVLHTVKNIHSGTTRWLYGYG